MLKSLYGSSLYSVRPQVFTMVTLLPPPHYFPDFISYALPQVQSAPAMLARSPPARVFGSLSLKYSIDLSCPLLPPILAQTSLSKIHPDPLITLFNMTKCPTIPCSAFLMLYFIFTIKLNYLLICYIIYLLHFLFSGFSPAGR